MPFAGIAYGYLNVRINALKPYLYAASFRCELHCIGEQIPDDLLQAIRIAGDQTDVGIKHYLQPNILGISSRPDRVNGSLDDRG